MNTGLPRMTSMLDWVARLENVTGKLQALACTTETQVRSVAKVFEDMAGHTSTILKTAAALVGCVEKENIAAVMPKVQILGAAARRFIGDRLQASAGILKTVDTEVNLLQQLSVVSRSQEAIAVQIKALSVLTNIEVAHLGAVGAGFQYLANELADFSRAVLSDTRELTNHAENRRHAIEETRRVLSAELPRQREQLARIEADLGTALKLVDSGLSELSRTPAQFKVCVEDVARQIAGVVAAIQAHDITRQQIEHVQAAFALIAARMRTAEDPGKDPEKKDASELSQAYAGLTIQVYQLRTIEGTVASWAAQIRTCMNGILTVSTSEVVGIGPAVLEQEREVSSQLARIELLEGESQAYSARIERNLGGLSNLMELVTEHVQRSKSIRDRLRLLTFNSIIEASRLGTQANAILAIAKCIKEVASEWNGITDQSANAMERIATLVTETSGAMKMFSGAGSETLREAQAQTSAALDNLRNVAAAAAGHAQEMKLAIDKMQSKAGEVKNSGDVLHASFGNLDEVLCEVEFVQQHLESHQPGLKHRYDATAVERMFSGSYTTELERQVLRAALAGTALPPPPTFAGNSVELF